MKEINRKDAATPALCDIRKGEASDATKHRIPKFSG
jgi:hypothetical protein